MFHGRDIFVVKSKLSFAHFVRVLLAVLFQHAEADFRQIISSRVQAVYRILKYRIENFSIYKFEDPNFGEISVL